MTINQTYWRFRWHGLILAWCLSVCGWVVVAMQPGTYQAAAQIYVNAGSSLEQLRDRLAADQQHFTVLDLVQKTSLDVRQLEGVIRAARPFGGSATADDKKRAVDHLLDTIRIGTVARWENLFSIRYSDTDRRYALAVVEAFVATIAEDSASNPDAAEMGESTSPDTRKPPQFKIIEPPAVAISPASSNRSLWMISILVASLGVGGGLAYLLGSRKPIFDISGRVSTIAGLPVVGVVTHAWLAQANGQHRRELMIFGFGAAMLILCFAAVLLI